MNSTLQHISTSSQKGERGKAPRPKSRLPPAAAAFAKQMGLDLTGLEAEADDIWSMLTNMSEDSPIEYENFVREQIAEGHAQSEGAPGAGGSATKSSGAEGSSGSSAEKETRYFRPAAGFCVRCLTTGGDGIKVRMDGEGKKLFVNICSFDAIEPPRDKAGRPVLEHRLSAEGMEFPLLVGPTRTHTDEDGNDCIAVDVIFHPSVVFHCKKEYSFKRQVVELALGCVMEETEVRFDPKQYDVLKSPEYAAGRGVDDATPVLFPVDHALKQSDPKQRAQNANASATGKSQGSSSNSSSGGGGQPNFLGGGRGGDSRRAPSTAPADGKGAFNLTMSSPQSLLSMSEAEREIEEDSLLNNLKLKADKSTSKDSSKPKKSLVQEVTEDSDAALIAQEDNSVPQSSADSVATSSTAPRESGGAKSNDKGPPLIKKGFLNASKEKGASLYPEGGSNEGAGGAKGGTYQRFMERCKVVDTSTMKVQSAPPVPPPSTSPLPPATAAAVAATAASARTNNTAVTSSIAASATKPAVSEPAVKEDKPLSEREHRKIDELFSRCDEDFGESVSRMESVRKADKMTDELGNLARVLSGGQAAGTDPALAAAEALSALRLNSDSDSAVGGSGDKTFVFPDGSEVIMKSQMISSAIIDVLKTPNSSDLTLSVKGLTSAHIGMADLKISDKCVELSFGPACGTVRLYLPHPQRFAAARTSAKMSKKKGTVDVFTSHVG